MKYSVVFPAFQFRLLLWSFIIVTGKCVFRGYSFLGRSLFCFSLVWKVCVGFSWVLLVWFCFPLFDGYTVLVSRPCRPVLVPFINRNHCFWMGWFNIAAGIRKSQTITSPHCTNNSDVLFFLAGNTAASGSFGRDCWKGSRVIEDLRFFLSPWYLFSYSFISRPLRMKRSFNWNNCISHCGIN